MTTIAFARGVLAADRMVTHDGKRVGLTRKVGRSTLGHLGAAGGSIDAMQRFLQWVEAGCEGNPPADNNGIGLVVYPNGRVFEWCGSTLLIPMRQSLHAIGSGGIVALTALMLGCGPAAAVRMAARLDVSTGGGVDTLRLTARRAKPSRAKASTG